ncbi:hypothetical protein [Streptomyces sp. MNP-20]|uniref:hypothetical protein n=1 Tax=Streptomyces sp. MNP-20 TaxID=2721165 RepID=UPI001C1E3B86|nr:hypothetical protein [Streptomyces sp. MNP-20]
MRRRPLTRLALLYVPVLLAASACSGDSESPDSEPHTAVSTQQATKVLDQVAARAPKLTAAQFCEQFAYQREACAYTYKQADDFCLKPGPEPRVLRSAAVPDTKDSVGGRVLEIEGKTAGGQRYVSEFFVTAPDGTPQASTAVYWSGAGLGDSPLGEDNTVLPQSECGARADG